MKKLFLMLLVTVTLNSYAQKDDQHSQDRNFKINSADSLKGDSVNRTMTFSGNVEFESGKLKIKAEEVFIDQKTNQIVVTGIKDLHFDGAVVFSKGSKHTVLKYTIGDDKVFVE